MPQAEKVSAYLAEDKAVTSNIGKTGSLLPDYQQT